MSTEDLANTPAPGTDPNATEQPQLEQNPADTSTEAVGQPEGDEVTEATTGAEQPTEGEQEAPVYTYNGTEVELEISEDLQAMFDEKGVDLNAVATELYSGDEFGLSDETKTKLYEQFGKFAVDSYLNGLKAQNDLTLSRFEADAKSAEQAAETAWNETLSIVGSEEGWESLMTYADENMSDQERDEWNEIMQSNNWTMQRLAIQDLASRAGVKPSEGQQGVHPGQGNNSMTGRSNESLELIEAQGGDARSNSGGAITAAEYRAQWSSDLSPAEMEALDARRRAGIAKGI